MLVNYSSSSEEEESLGHEVEQRSPRAEDSRGEAPCNHQSPDLRDWEPPTLHPGSNRGTSDCNVAAAAEMKRHESRVRTFPHVEGMYPTLVMIPVPLGPPELEALACCIHHLQQLLPGQLHPMIPQLQKSRPDCQLQQQQQQQPKLPSRQTMHAGLKRPRPQFDEQTGDLHISLSHCVPVRFADLELLVGHLKESMQPCQRPDCITLEGLSTFCNTECTRTFLSVPVVQGAKQVVSMTKAVNRSFSVLGLRTFHKDPKPHMSLAWMLGDQRSHLEQAIRGYHHQQSQQRGHQSQQQHSQQQQQQQQQVLWPPGQEPDSQLHREQQQQKQGLSPCLPSSCQWQGPIHPRHGCQNARHTCGELSDSGPSELPEGSPGWEEHARYQQEVSVGTPGLEQSVGYQQEESVSGPGKGRSLGDQQEVSGCGQSQEQRLEYQSAHKLAAQGRGGQATTLGSNNGTVQGSACWPCHSLFLQAVLCRAAQKEFVVWGELGTASRAGVSQKRRK